MILNHLLESSPSGNIPDVVLLTDHPRFVYFQQFPVWTENIVFSKVKSILTFGRSPFTQIMTVAEIWQPPLPILLTRLTSHFTRTLLLSQQENPPWSPPVLAEYRYARAFLEYL